MKWYTQELLKSVNYYCLLLQKSHQVIKLEEVLETYSLDKFLLKF